MKRSVAVIVAVVFHSMIWNSPVASAQQASSFEQLQVLAKPGDKIEVLDSNGIKTKGRIESLTPTTLRLNSKNNVRDFSQKDALEVKQKRSDSLANGALIGAATAGGITGLSFLAVCSGGECDGDGGTVAAAIFIYAGLGAAIGTGIDALFKHYQTVYRQPAQSTIKTIRLDPLLSSGRKGAWLRISF